MPLSFMPVSCGFLLLFVQFIWYSARKMLLLRLEIISIIGRLTIKGTNETD
jgi:hypothetical protein